MMPDTNNNNNTVQLDIKAIQQSLGAYQLELIALNTRIDQLTEENTQLKNEIAIINGSMGTDKRKATKSGA